MELENINLLMGGGKNNCLHSEINLFVIWSKARNKEAEIIQEIKNNFSILEIYEIKWDKNLFKKNLERFYCEKIRKKIKHTGTDKFLLITVKDEKPLYNYEKTLKGIEFVNSKVLNLKKKLRQLTNGGYKIHATNNIYEADKNLIFLIGKSYKDYFNCCMDKTFDGNYIQYNKQPYGTNNFNSIDEVFKLLNSSLKYVLLRNFNENEGDIDLLVEDYEKAVYLLNAKKVHRQKYRCQYKVIINGKEVLFDIRSTGDNYYCEKWEENILNNRVFCEKGFYIPNNTDLFYSLIYHCSFHKKEISNKYNTTLQNLLEQTEKLSIAEYKNPFDLYLKLLSKFMKENGYYTIKPTDKKVKYNQFNIEKMFWIDLLSERYSFKNIQGVTIDKKPSSGFAFFFTAEYNNTKVFIKCGTGHFDAKHEFEVYEYLNKQNNKYFPKEIMYENLQDNKMFLCIEYIDGELLSEEIIKNATEQKLNNMFNSLYDIAQILYNNKFIHRDINYNNLLVKNDGNIKLVDFQHLIGNKFKESQENIIFPKRLRGTNKHLRPGNYIWDDMYSLYIILSKFSLNNNVIPDYKEKLSDIKSKIGKNRYYYFDNKFPIQSYWNFKLLFV